MKRALQVLALALAVAGCSREEPRAERDPYVYGPIRTACAYIALTEKPDAVRALLIGEEAKALAPVFERAGVRTSASLGGAFDIVLVACEEMSAASCTRASAHLADGGVLAWMMDVRGDSVGRVRSKIRSFSLEGVHLWMPGEGRWMLVGRRADRKVRLAAMLDLFAREGAFADQERAKCGTLSETFANYAGTREDVMPAFAMLDLAAEARPENFVTRDVRPVGWIATDGMDADLSAAALAEVRSMQVVRRLVLEGNLIASAATDRKEEERATETWARAALRNPNDLLLCERVDRLNRNAKGFLEVGKVLQAMKCYETIVLINPNDAAAVHNFGMCLRKIGKLDLAEKVLAKARRLAEANP